MKMLRAQQSIIENKMMKVVDRNMIYGVGDLLEQTIYEVDDLPEWMIEQNI